MDVILEVNTIKTIISMSKLVLVKLFDNRFIFGQNKIQIIYYLIFVSVEL